MGLVPGLELCDMVFFLNAENGMQVVDETLLRLAVLRGDEDGVIALNRADDLRPVGAVDGHRNAARRTCGGADHSDRWTCGLDLAHEARDRCEAALRPGDF